MEKIKKVKDKDLNSRLSFISQNAMGNPIVFKAAPTLAQMKANTLGFYGTDMYIKFADGTGLKVSGSALS